MARSADGTAVVGAIRLASAGLALIAVCYGLARFAYGLFVPVLREEFGFGNSTAGIIASSSYAAYCVGIVLATVATARWGARPIAVLAGITAAVGTSLIAASWNTGALAVGVVVAGASTGVASPPLADAAARFVDPARSDRVQTVINAGTGLGVMVSGPVALLTEDSWRVAWWAFAVITAAVTIWNALAVPAPSRTRASDPGTARGSEQADHQPTTALDATRGSTDAQEAVRSEVAAQGSVRGPADAPGSTNGEATGQADRASWRELLPEIWWPPGAGRMLLAAALMGAGSSAVWTFGRELVVTTGGISQADSTVLWIVLGAAGLLGAATGDLSARIGLGRAWLLAMLALAAATAGLAYASRSYPADLLAAAVFGAVYIALSGILLLWGTRIYPDRPAFGVGAAFLLVAVGQAIGAPLVGALLDATTAPIAFTAAAATLTIGSVLRPNR